ncbi:hypothetical protein COU74_02915 [Candidatus Peregrinibacteria bacterium CG10_big_fil_rev_8_21_14_0_10_36_19]|nr:MAG: hypothetical protein COU74_02915 [Candidatus Peregrinibacteria bacterium CG10_big_fil_rev_8_21_14_0_10_36_19]
MEQGKSNIGTVVLAVIITAVLVGGGVYYYFQSTTETEQPVAVESIDEVETPIIKTTPAPQKSLVEYYETRVDAETLGESNSFLMKTPDELGLKEIAKVKIACPENADGPCGGDLLILSQESLHSGNQEFYFAQAGGAGYTYYGPFSDDLKRLVEESKTIDLLKEVY